MRFRLPVKTRSEFQSLTTSSASPVALPSRGRGDSWSGAFWGAAAFLLFCTAHGMAANEPHPASPGKETAPAGEHASPDAQAGHDTHHPPEGGHAPGEDGHSGGDHHGEGGGHHEPYSIWSDLPLWSLLAFVGFVLAIKVLGLWQYMLNCMDSRERDAIEAIRAAESKLSAAQSGLQASRGRIEALDETIRGAMAEADRDARTTQQDILAAAEREAKLFGERAQNEIRRVQDQSLDSLFASLAEKVVAVTEARLRSEFGDDDQSRLIDETLGQLSL